MQFREMAAGDVADRLTRIRSNSSGVRCASSLAEASCLPSLRRLSARSLARRADSAAAVFAFDSTSGNRLDERVLFAAGLCSCSWRESVVHRTHVWYEEIHWLIDLTGSTTCQLASSLVAGFRRLVAGEGRRETGLTHRSCRLNRPSEPRCLDLRTTRRHPRGCLL